MFSSVTWSADFAQRLVTNKKRLLIPYDRELYGHRSHPTSQSRGFFTGQSFKTNIDHVVSLKDVHQSGADRWIITKPINFANDRANHVPTCRRVNSSQGSSTPSDFFRKSSDGRGMEYEIKNKGTYLGIYVQIKKSINLHLAITMSTYLSHMA